jgi:hypothetical protein
MSYAIDQKIKMSGIQTTTTKRKKGTNIDSDDDDDEYEYNNGDNDNQIKRSSKRLKESTLTQPKEVVVSNQNQNKAKEVVVVTTNPRKKRKKKRSTVKTTRKKTNASSNKSDDDDDDDDDLLDDELSLHKVILKPLMELPDDDEEDPKYVILEQFVTFDCDNNINEFLDIMETQTVEAKNIIIQQADDINGIPATNDNKRLHFTESEMKNRLDNKFIKMLQTIFEKLENIMLPFDRSRTVHEVAIVLSKDGCGMQDLHTDYPIDPNHPLKQFTTSSFFAVVALMENTSIIVEDRTETKQFEETYSIPEGRSAIITKEITIPKGSAFIGRGDLVHAGNSFIQSNVRLHYYIDNKYSTSNGFKQRDTYFVDNCFPEMIENLTLTIVQEVLDLIITDILNKEVIVSSSSAASLKNSNSSSTIMEIIDLTSNNDFNSFQEIESLTEKIFVLKGINYKFVPIKKQEEVENNNYNDDDDNDQYEEEHDEELNMVLQVNDEPKIIIKQLEAQIKKDCKKLEKKKKQLQIMKINNAISK